MEEIKESEATLNNKLDDLRSKIEGDIVYDKLPEMFYFSKISN